MWLRRFEPREPAANSMNTIAQQIRELKALTPTQLAARYATLFGKQPRVRNKAFMQRQLAWKLQERQLGGLPERAKARLEELIAEVDLPLGELPSQPPQRSRRAASNAPMVGTTLVRQWHDQEIRVEVREGGFEWNNTLYRSLSAVAKAVTGCVWNGRLFFNLVKRRPAK